ncbi:MAG TPA: MacB family efflux pump subunit [Candidatus Omnitrophica bacterium]|nr:MacB family efflux pump subunit [Candidatus Omnitrophota bacterium]
MIEIKNVHKAYRMGGQPVKALDGVSLKLEPGEFVAIMGASGSGKSTLMHVLGLLDRPDRGEYLLGGKPLSGLSDEKVATIRNSTVGFVFQQFHLLPRMTALENVELPLVYAGKRHLAKKAKETLSVVGLGDRMLHRPNELSGGQQQRVAIARALINDPAIIMADEPTGNLDSKSLEEIMGILRSLNEEGKTVVVVTHENEVAAYARRVIILRDGKIISDKRAAPGHMPASFAGKALSEELPAAGASKAGGIKALDYFRQAVSATVSHKMRSALSILGVLIGVAAVIAMLALGEGAKASIQKQLASLGSNLLVVRAGSRKVHGIAQEAGSVTRFTFQDVNAIRRLGDEVKKVSPSVSGRAQIVYGASNWNTQVTGVDVDYAQMRDYMPEVGRFFTQEEVAARDKVVLLGPTVAYELFGGQDPVDETVKINQINFKVIGVLPAKGATTYRDQDDIVMIPVTTALFRLLGKEYVDSIYVEARDAGSTEALLEEIEAIIIRQHRITKDREDSFEIRNMSDIREVFESTTKTMSVLLGCIAAISLLVGGIGIMNIMLVSVTERTREIGLRKAIGATDKDIMTQFLIEAVLMSFIGGVGGIFLGAGASSLINLLAGWSVKVTVFSIMLAAFFSLAVGVVFGLWPAKQASSLSPIEALRYE